MSDITLDINIRTSKAGVNVRSLTKDTDGLHVSLDRVNKSTQLNAAVSRRASIDQVSSFGRIRKAATSALGPAGLVGLAAVAGTSVVGMTRRAIRVGREYEQQLADLEAITGIAGRRQDFLSQRALAASVKYGESASNIIEANKLVASQLAEKIDFGTDEGAKQLADISEQAIVLQKASGVDLPTAVKTLTTAINQFNLPASESERIINSIAAGAKFGAAEVANQALTYKEAGSVMAGADQDFETLNASTQVLAQNAIVGSQAGTQLRGVMLTLQNTAKLTQAGIEGVSLKTDGYVNTLRALKPLLEDSVALEKLFGRENIAAARILISNADAVEEMTQKVTGGNVAYEQAEIQLDTFQGAQARLAAAIDAEFIPAFQRSSGVIVSMINGLTWLVQEFGGGLDVINGWVAGFRRMGEARGYLTTIMDAFSDWLFPLSTIKGLLEDLGIIESREQFERMFDTIDAGSQSIKDQINYLFTHVETLSAERDQMEENSEVHQIYSQAIEGSISKLKASREEFTRYLATLQSQRSETKEGSFEYAELTEKIGQAEKALELINDRLGQITSSQSRASASTQDLSQSVAQIASSYTQNKERIDELVNSQQTLTQAEWEELASLTAQNKAIKEQVETRKELAEFFNQSVNSPVSAPLDVVLPDSIEIPDLAIEAPLKTIQQIMDELNTEVEQYQTTSQLIGDSTGDINFAITRTKQAISELIANGYHPQSQQIQELIANLDQLEQKYESIAQTDYLARFTGDQVADTLTGIQQINMNLRDHVDHIRARADADKAAADTAKERAQIEKKAQAEMARAEKVAKEQRKAAIKETISASISEAIIVQFGKVIKTLPFPINVIAAPIAAAAVKVAMNKFVALNRGGQVPGPAHETRDTIPAILTPQEFVVRKASANAAPQALDAMNKDPRVARQVEQFVQSGSLSKGLASRALLSSASTDVTVSAFNAGGIVGNSLGIEPTINPVINKLVEREILGIQSAEDDKLLLAINELASITKNQRLNPKFDFVEFNELYQEFLEKEGRVGR